LASNTSVGVPPVSIVKIEGKTFVIISPSPSARRQRSNITRCQNNQGTDKTDANSQEQVLHHSLESHLKQAPDGFGARRLIMLGRRRAKLPRFREGYFGTSGLPGQYFDLVKIELLASASVSKSPI
jgi:hypothetical protein